jgi:phage repressor protein C with HTH and peptisase S24 domain
MTKRLVNKKEVSPLGKRVEQLISAANFKHIKDFEAAAGVRHDAIRRLCGGYVKNLPPDELQKVASTLKVSIEELFSANKNSSNTIPLNVATGAGDPCWFQVSSDEMYPTLKHGEFVLVDLSINQINGAGIYLLDKPSCVVFMRISQNHVTDKITLQVDNKLYDAAEETDVSKVKIRGKVLGKFQHL